MLVSVGTARGVIFKDVIMNIIAIGLHPIELFAIAFGCVWFGVLLGFIFAGFFIGAKCEEDEEAPTVGTISKHEQERKKTGLEKHSKPNKEEE